MFGSEQSEGLDELSRRGLAIYEGKLKAILEPEYNNQFIAIHPDTEDYTIADSTGNAMRAMRKRHATGRLLLMKIGPEPEYGLAARILASDMAAGDKAKGNLLQAEMQTGGEVSLEPLEGYYRHFRVNSEKEHYMSEPQWQERLKVEGEHLADQVKALIEEGNVRHLVIKHEEHTVLEIPVTLGVAVAVFAPTLAAVAAAGAVLTHCTIEVIRTGPPSL